MKYINIWYILTLRCNIETYIFLISSKQLTVGCGVLVNAHFLCVRLLCVDVDHPQPITFLNGMSYVSTSIISE